jgi:hypothetical protein
MVAVEILAGFSQKGVKLKYQSSSKIKSVR